jgi:hypothetical protein
MAACSLIGSLFYGCVSVSVAFQDDLARGTVATHRTTPVIQVMFDVSRVPAAHDRNP